LKIANRQFVAPVLKFAGGFSLSEMLVVISVIVLLIGIGIPAARQITDSFESSAGLRNVISTALSNARAIATKNQKYAGLRFQQDQNGRQYMIFIVHESPENMGGLTIGFRAVQGLKPVKLPANAGLMDMRVRVNHDFSFPAAEDPRDKPIEDSDLDNTIAENMLTGRNRNVTDTTAFTIIFSPSGKLVTYELRTRNNDGEPDSVPSPTTSDDDVFNGYDNVINNNVGMFIQDDWAALGLGAEVSRNHFIIYDKRAFAAVGADSRWTDYLSGLEVLYVNPYTGEIINK